MFSERTPSGELTNRLARALAARARPFLDLTRTNPTSVELGLDRSQELALLADARGASYEPDPKGLLRAREAVAGYYAGHGVTAEASRVLLSASTSEAYSWLFKLLASPSEAVLVPAPSYPLLDALAGLEGVVLRRYPLDEADGWRLHAGSVAAAAEEAARAGHRVAAAVVVNPNNPTGSSVSVEEWGRLTALAAERGFALVSDEVFLDYRFAPAASDVRVGASEPGGALVFSLGGLSKTAALPQLKLGWVLAGGPEPLVAEALHRLEWIADAFLSVSTPVQLALPGLLARAPRAAAAVTDRVLRNEALLREAFRPSGAVSVLPVPAGWAAVLRVPALVPEEELVLSLLSEEDLLVHPGYFFEFPHEAFLVLSLLPETGELAEGVARLARRLSEGAP